MSTIGLILVAYAVIVLLGGVMGFVTSKSTASLAASIPSALLIGLAAFLVNGHARLALALAIAVCGVLAIIFTMRYTKTRKAMPAIPMLLISDAVLVACAYKLLHLLHVHKS